MLQEYDKLSLLSRIIYTTTEWGTSERFTNRRSALLLLQTYISPLHTGKWVLTE